ncbi:hypothetical protein M23134_02996 [Microscilla marina ATCC 23134]|uniref:Uncharacterized protein n=1 Tax=Microscilla marina ATCC 23134 TaxID=313606 RepID=A1ZY35_MICM2|nr:hypothetical protein M23134_02996 [Microscilla marina ATCC 23134]
MEIEFTNSDLSEKLSNNLYPNHSVDLDTFLMKKINIEANIAIWL